MTGLTVTLLVLAGLEGRPCEPVDVARVEQGVAIPEGTMVRLECDDGLSRLVVLRPGSEAVSRTVRLEQVDETQRVALLQLLVEETLAVPSAPVIPPTPEAAGWEASAGPSVAVTSGVSLGGGLRAARRLASRWVLLGALTAGGWSEPTELGRVSWQHVDASLALAFAVGARAFELRVGLLLRSGVVAGQGTSTLSEVESRAVVGAFGGPGLHLGLVAALGERWFVSAHLEPGLSLFGTAFSAGTERRGFSRWWLVSGLGVGLRW